MQKYALPSFLCLSALLFASTSIGSAEGALSWSIQTVDEYSCSSGYGTACPIVVDSKSIPHIAYTSIGDPWCAVYASLNGSSWVGQTLAQDSLVQCLALDANDNPHIIYLNRGSGHFEYASWTGSNWSIQDTGIKDGYFFALEFDNTGNPHIVYTSGYSAEGYMINYASWTGTNWDTNIIGISDGREVSFALDSKDKPYILYSPSSYADFNMTVGIRAATIRLASYQHGSWNIQTLSLPPPTGQIGNIVIDSNDNIHFICTQHHFVSEEDKTILSNILYASRDGDALETQVVARDVVLQSIGQLVLDANDNPHYTYLTPAPDGETSSYYVCWTGNAWGSQTIKTSDGKTACGSLAIDTSGHPHICSIGRSMMRYTAPLLYTTAIGTMDIPTFGGAETILDTSILIIIATISTAIVISIVFVWKKKANPKK